MVFYFDQTFMFIFRQKLDKIVSSLSLLETRMSRLSNEYAIKDLKETIQRIVGRIETMEVS